MRQFKFHSSIAMGMVLLISCCILACHPSPPIPNVPSSQQPSSTEQPVKRPAEFEVGSLTVTPSPLVAGGSATVSANVQNTGDETGVYVAILSLDGQTIDRKEVNLGPQQSSTVEFTVASLAAGKHVISIGESKVSIDVSPKLTKIAFVATPAFSSQNANLEIFTINSDGTNVVNVTNSASNDFYPTWSADGTKIAFESAREWHGQRSIYIMDADGKNVKCLTPEASICQFPAWSPDGNKIAYCKATTRDVTTFATEDIFIMNYDGSEKTRLTFAQGSVSNVCPSWFPDSQRIAFVSNRGNWVIDSMNIDGSEAKRHEVCLAPNCGLGRFPSGQFPSLAVSPDGSSITFEYVDVSRRCDICVLTINTGEVKKLTGSVRGNSHYPSWSPDGTRIAFTLETNDNFGIYIMDSDGSNVTLLVQGGNFPAWQR